MKTKSFTKAIAAAILVITIALGTVFVLADVTPHERGITRNIEAVFGRILLTVNGQNVDRETLLYDSTTYLPLRVVAEMIGYDVDFDEDTMTAILTRPTPGLHGLVVFWGRTGTRVHISETCRTFNLTPHMGSIEKAADAGRFGWCQVCSYNLEDRFPIYQLRDQLEYGEPNEY